MTAADALITKVCNAASRGKQQWQWQQQPSTDNRPTASVCVRLLVRIPMRSLHRGKQRPTHKDLRLFQGSGTPHATTCGRCWWCSLNSAKETDFTPYINSSVAQSSSMLFCFWSVYCDSAASPAALAVCYSLLQGMHQCPTVVQGPAARWIVCTCTHESLLWWRWLQAALASAGWRSTSCHEGDPAYGEPLL